MNALISVDHLTFRYSGEGAAPAPALDDVCLQFQPGEFTCILGANGSGKTTLARHLNGLLTPHSGKVLVAGLDTRDKRNLGAIRQRVGMVFQHPEDQIIASTVEEDIAFGPENLGLPPEDIRRRVESAMEASGLQAHRNRPPHLLSGGQTQRLALAGVLAMRPDAVVFDEATTMLDPAGRRMALEWMADLRAAGLTVLFVTHNMQEAALADRAVVLNGGRVVFDGPPRALFAHTGLASWGLELPPVAALAARLRACLPGLPDSIMALEELLAGLPAGPGGEPVGAPYTAGADAAWRIEVQGLEHVYLSGTPLAHTALQAANLRVAEGRAHGLVGATGSGKSTLLQHLNGLLRPQKGSVRVGPYTLGLREPPTREVTRLAALVMQNPEMQFFETYVGDEIAFGPRQYPLHEALAARVRRAMETVGLNFESFKDRPTHTLSGGEKRKVALASALALQPGILLLDEPTAGLDPVSRRHVLAVLRMRSADGVDLVLSSHQMEDIAVLAADVTAFRKGSDVLSGAAGEVFSRTERLHEIGLEAPVAAVAAQRLRDLGWPLPPGLITADALVDALERIERARA